MADDLAGEVSADVVVVGAGPAGSSTAYHLASLGADVLLLDKAEFPRDKICGDGLTPAAVHELILMGVDTGSWTRNRGLTVIGGGHTVTMDWPDQKSLPGYGLTRARASLDETLARRAQAAGARLHEGVTVTGALTDASGRVTGVVARRGRGPHATEITARARFVVDAGGVAARLATSLGIEKAPSRPMGVAARAYFHSPRGDEEYMESHLELWSGAPGASDLLPGYGWIFPMGDGVVNVGLGSVSSTANATALPYKQVFEQWTANLPEEWGFTPDNRIGALRSAALPMSFNRTPHYACGLVLVGDAGGMVSPFNGEGIAPGLKAGRYAADCIAQALARPTRAGADRAMSAYPQMLRDEYGGYYQLGRIFVALIENPRIMRLCTYHGLPIPRLMTLVHKLLSDGYERSGGDIDDRLITALSKMVPAV
ncbi:geranylgeranyl reductase family protein [Actinomyces sp. B33]|uniref:geranylgeranyl reductase family protein n=1 Tax=Actinomyces sp. B33 TaxID=2942131 RepID=UPI0023425745|nr:geranylgeranyl reductase family protein [Actinomyces sp. B33]MDC4233542.1 geranylgeranyl reductase family protein [Actinomyces sp. B33]